jgi:hypothetical protein
MPFEPDAGQIAALLVAGDEHLAAERAQPRRHDRIIGRNPLPRVGQRRRCGGPAEDGTGRPPPVVSDRARKLVEQVGQRQVGQRADGLDPRRRHRQQHTLGRADADRGADPAVPGRAQPFLEADDL